MVYKIKKDLNKRHLYLKTFYYRNIFKSFYKNPKLSIEERHLLKLISLKINNHTNSITKLKNHCILTQNSKSIYKCVKLSRHTFKNMVLNGQLPGCV